MTIPQYRVPGYPSARSLNYLQALESNKWPALLIEQLKIDLPRFESASVRYNFETALKACVNMLDPAHYPFLRDLNEHIQISCKAEINEELRRKATSNDKDSIVAGNILTGGAGNTAPPLDRPTGREASLSEMSFSDLEKEIKETESRLGTYDA